MLHVLAKNLIIESQTLKFLGAERNENAARRLQRGQNGTMVNERGGKGSPRGDPSSRKVRFTDPNQIGPVQLEQSLQLIRLLISQLRNISAIQNTLRY
jgi:hypothetical protein